MNAHSIVLFYYIIKFCKDICLNNGDVTLGIKITSSNTDSHMDIDTIYRSENYNIDNLISFIEDLQQYINYNNIDNYINIKSHNIYSTMQNELIKHWTSHTLLENHYYIKWKNNTV